MAEVTEKDIEAAASVIGRWHSMPNETRLMSWKMLIADAIAQAREEGKREGVDAAAQFLATCGYGKLTRREWRDVAVLVRALLPETPTPGTETEGEK